MARAVVITGVGPVTGSGIGADALLATVATGMPAPISYTDVVAGQVWATFPAFCAGPIDLPMFGLPPDTGRRLASYGVATHRELHTLLAASRLALTDARLDYDPHDNCIGIVVTCEAPGVDAYVREVATLACELAASSLPANIVASEKEGLLVPRDRHALLDLLFARHATAVYNLQSFMYPFLMASLLGLHGPATFLNHACASGLYALEVAAQSIRAGHTPIVVVAGADFPLSAAKYRWFHDQGLYADDGRMKPFDVRRNGIVFGDGGTALVLEDAEHARRRDAPVYGEYLGGGFAQEAWKIFLPEPSTRYLQRAIGDALEHAGCTAGQIAIICAHGAATPLGDMAEARALTTIWPDPVHRPPIVALKPYVGHNLGGSALMELGLALLTMRQGWVPAMPNITSPDPALGLTPLTEPYSLDISYPLLLKVAIGFAGYLAAAVVRVINQASEVTT